MPLDKVKEIIAEQFNVSEDDLSNETSFVEDLTADSLDLFQLITVLEEEFGIEIANEDVEKIKTVGDVTKYISEHFE